MPHIAAAVVIAASMATLWVVSVRIRDASIVDSFWGPGYLLATAAAWLATGAELEPRPLLALAMVGLWGGRLGLHIFTRNHGNGEDHRYVKMRESHGDRFWWVSAFTVFGFQGLLMFLISMPLQLAVTGAGGFAWTDGVAVAVFAIGFAFETIGDKQLRDFKRIPRDERPDVLDTGLWRYSRHPNYFGEAVLWYGMWLLALGEPCGWATGYAPIAIHLLLLYVSGVPLLEKHMSKRPAYREYMERTSRFVPLPPKS